MALLHADKDERRLHVRSHAARVAAYVDIGAPLDPRVQLGRLLLHPMLHVDSLRSVTREREIKAMQLLFRQRLLPLDLVEEFGAKVPIGEEQPVSTTRSRRRAMLDEGPERRNSGAGANHDDVSIAVYGQSKTLIGFEEDPRMRASPRSVR